VSSGPSGRRWRRWVIGGVVALVVLAVGVPFVYIHFVEGPAPAKLGLSSTPAPGASLSNLQIDGRWVVGKGSEAGYRVQEVLAGQNNTAVGRTTTVTGSLRIAGTTITAGTFVVDLRTVTSDQSERDAQFNGRIMNTAEFPDATFTLTAPIRLGRAPRVNQTVTVKAAGTLTMHGETRPVAVTIQARDTGSALEMSGEIPIRFANWGIANPSFGSFVRTKDDGLVEFLLQAARASQK
jgi:polyisoprenoid-binding protein YceI